MGAIQLHELYVFWRPANSISTVLLIIMYCFLAK